VVFVALAGSVALVALGAVGIVYPGALVGVAQFFQISIGLYIWAGIRLVFGVALVFAATTSRAPTTLRVFGVVVFVVGLTMPLFGVEHFRSLLEQFLRLGAGFHRALGIVAFVFGALLTYALVPRSRAA
jgi:hypothetical protein